MYIKPTKDAKSLWDFNEDLAMDALLQTTHPEVSCPWDADIEVEGDTVIITGGLMPGGPGASPNSCVCKCSIQDFTKYYRVEVPDTIVNSIGLEGSGWVEA